jgi:predicted aldo/keto reductase-like oxidoreductase
MTKLSRRAFLHASALAAAGTRLAGADPLQGQPTPAPKVRRYKPFGKTGWMVGDISGGSGQNEPAVFDHMFRCGINLVDTGVQYSGHEEVLGTVLPKWRDKVFVVDKWDPPFVTPTVTKSALLEALDASLKRLNTTYIDCMMIHSIGHPRYGGIERIQNPAIHEAWDEAKRLKKIRFTGASSHGARMLEEIGWGIDNNRFDVILIGANFLTHGVEPLLKKARAKGIATMAMKTMTIYKSDLNIRALQGKETNARQACIKWVLASDLFDTAVIRMPNFDTVAEYLAVSGTTRLTAEDRGYLDVVSASVGPRYCRPGCSGCYGTCPRDVPVADVLRYKMYFENYRDEKHAIERYAQIPPSRRASACAGCDAPCERACPYGVQVRERLVEAHRQLSLA